MSTVTTTTTTVTETPKAKITRTKTYEQPCWTCKFATGRTEPHSKSPNKNGLFTCPWATQQQPVPGWTATQTQLKVSPMVVVPSYNIESCPYHTPDLGGIIEAMPLERVAKLLHLSLSFVKRRITASKHVLYQYAQALNKIKEKRGKDYKPTPEEAYKLKIAVINDIIDQTSWEIEDSADENEAAAGTLTDTTITTGTTREKEIKDAKYLLKGCQEILKAYQIQRKRALKRAQQQREQQEQQERAQQQAQ